MRKRDCLLIGLAALLALSLAGHLFLKTVIPTGAWGLSFRQEGAAPIGPASSRELARYGGAYLGDTTQKVLYLTFDAGFENGCTGKILDVLKGKKVPATFFCTLDYLKSEPEFVARMINEGHIVGNHSVNHPDFSTISREKMAMEIQELDNYLRTRFGYSSPFFRFPEGSCSENALELVQSVGYKSVFWSSAYADWDVNNQKGKQYAFDTVTSRLHPGCILLLHSVSRDNTEALGEIIDYAIALDIIKKSGSWFSYNGERIGQGKDNVRKLIESDPALLAELDAQIRSMKDKLPDAEEEFELDEDDDEFDIRTVKDDEEL